EERILDAVRIDGAAEIERGGVTGGGGGEIAAGRGHVAEIDQGGRNVQLVIAGGEVLACLLELAGGGGEMALVLFENGHVVEHRAGLLVLVEAAQQRQGALVEVEGGIPIAGCAAAIALDAEGIGGLDAIAGGKENAVRLLAAGGRGLRGVAVDVGEALLEAEMGVKEPLAAGRGGGD